MTSVSVSILTPNYNDGRHLEKTLLKFLPILPPDWEYLIGDDASTDNSLLLIQDICSKYPNCRVFSNARNMGIAKTINRLIKEAKGKYVYGVSANDVLLEGLVKDLPDLVRKTDAGVIATDPAEYTDDIDNLKVYPLLLGCTHPILWNTHQTMKLFRHTKFWIPGHSSLVRKDLLVKFGSFDENLKLHCDWYINHLAALDAGVLYIPNTLISLMHRKEGSYSNSFSKKEMKKIVWNVLHKTKTIHSDIKFRIYKSGIFSGIIKKIFPEILLYPKYWIFMPFIAVRVFFTRIPSSKTYWKRIFP